MDYVFSERERNRWLRIWWAEAKYTPTEGYFPINDLDGELRTVSRGQAEIHECPNRLIMVTGGVRAGKSQWLAMEMLKEVFVRDGLIWLVAPDYEQAKAEFDYMFAPLKVHDMLLRQSVPERGSRQFTTTWGCRVQTKSSQDLTTLASFAPHALAGLEMGQQPHDAFDKLQERALEHGARVIMTGTLEDAQPWYADLWDKWQATNEEGGKSFSLPSWSNTVKFPGGRDDPKIKALEAGITPELFLQRVAAVPYKPSGLVFKLFDRKLHVPEGGLVYDPELPIEIAIDPAQHTYAVLAIQWKPIPGMFTTNNRGQKVPLTEVRVIDEVYEHDTTAYDVIPLVQNKPWFKHVTSGVIDQAGKQRHANKSQVQIWREETGVILRSKYVSIPEGIEVVRHRMRVHPDAKQPLILFDYRLRTDRDHGGRANGTIAEMGLYRWPDWREGMATPTRPIDANNDGCKALGYWCFDRFGSAIERPPVSKKRVIRGYL